VDVSDRACDFFNLQLVLVSRQVFSFYLSFVLTSMSVRVGEWDFPKNVLHQSNRASSIC
jgi:hypothetical protein